MSKEWLSAQSFERLHRLVSAINTISIHAKLELSGVNDSNREVVVIEARDHLLSFLEGFESVVKEAEGDPDLLTPGVDPRMGDLARGLMEVRRQRPQTSALASVSIEQVRNLLMSNEPEDQKFLIAYLRDLRRLLEQQVHADVVSILGEL